MMPIQPGDVLETSADTKPLYDAVGFRPQTTVRQGVKNFVDWYKAYYKANHIRHCGFSRSRTLLRLLYLKWSFGKLIHPAAS
jgi:dTDP-D-glucose 4,6-dehydratase